MAFAATEAPVFQEMRAPVPELLRRPTERAAESFTAVTAEVQEVRATVTAPIQEHATSIEQMAPEFEQMPTAVQQPEATQRTDLRTFPQ